MEVYVLVSVPKIPVGPVYGGLFREATLAMAEADQRGRGLNEVYAWMRDGDDFVGRFVGTDRIVFMVLREVLS